MFLKIILLTCHVLLIIKAGFKTQVIECSEFDKQSSGRLMWLEEQEKSLPKAPHNIVEFNSELN